MFLVEHGNATSSPFKTHSKQKKKGNEILKRKLVPLNNFLQKIDHRQVFNLKKKRN